MTKIKIILTSSLAVLMFSGLFNFASAQESANNNPPSIKLPQGTVLLATTNISDAAISGQNGNQMKVSFSLSNKENVQTNILYAIDLVTGDENQDLISQMVYGEKISLNGNESVKREVAYAAPAGLSGTYQVFVTAKNSDGLILGRVSAGKIELAGTGLSLSIDASSCRIKNEKSGDEKGFSQPISGSAGDHYSGRCQAKNNANQDVSGTLKLELKRKSNFGEVLYASSQSLNFKPNEEKNIDFSLPGLDGGQPAQLALYFEDGGGNMLSQTAQTSLLSNQAQATLINVRFDKDTYKAGEQAKIFLNVSSNLQNAENYKVAFSLTDYNESSCIDPPQAEKDISIDDLKNTIEIDQEISRDCINPKLFLAVKDQSGNIIDSNDYLVQTKSAAAEDLLKKQKEAQRTHILIRNAVLVIIILILAVLLIKNIYLKIKYRHFTLPLLLLSVALFSLFSAHKARASSWQLQSGIILTADTDKDQYHTDDHVTETITVSNQSGSPYLAQISAEDNFNFHCTSVINQTIASGNSVTVAYTIPTAVPSPTGNYLFVELGISPSCSDFIMEPLWYENGVCGPHNGTDLTSKEPLNINPTKPNWCQYGYINAIDAWPTYDYNNNINWICQPLGYNATGAHCSATASVRGKCGTYQSQPICAADIVHSYIGVPGYGCDISGFGNVIIYGDYYKNLITYSDHFTWTCQGTSPGNDVSCSSSINTSSQARCGTAINNPPSNIAPAINLCSNGSANPAPHATTDGSGNPIWSWVCTTGYQDDYACDATCQSPRIPDGQCSSQANFNNKNEILTSGCAIGSVSGGLSGITGSGSVNSSSPWQWTCTNAANGGGVSSTCSGYQNPVINFTINSGNTTFVKNIVIPFQWTVNNASTAFNGCTASCKRGSNNCPTSTWYSPSPYWTDNKLHADNNPYSYSATFSASGTGTFNLTCINGKGGSTTASVPVIVTDAPSNASCGNAANRSYCTDAQIDSARYCVNGSILGNVSPSSDGWTWTCNPGNISCSAHKFCSSDAVWKEVGQ